MRARLSLLFPAAIALACGANPSSTSSPTSGTRAASTPPPTTAGTGSTASLTIERLATGGACAGLVPEAAPSPTELRADVPAGSVGTRGTADGTGAVVLAWTDPAGSGGVATFGADGTTRGVSPVVLEMLAPQPSGFHAISGAADGARFVAIAPDGTVVRDDPVSAPELGLGLVAARLAPDPQGGAIVLARGTHEAGNHWFELLAGRRDESGAPAADPARITNGADPTQPMFFGGAVSATGAALAVWGELGVLRTAWLGANGVPVSGPADDGAAADVGLGFGSVPELAPLLDGTIALRADGAWRRAWAPGAGMGGAPPAWLAERPGTSVRIVRGGAGYALVPDDASSPSCEQRVEIRDAAGALCGAVTVTWSNACPTARIDVGRDGTLVALTSAAQEPCTGTTCTLAATAWPALLR